MGQKRNVLNSIQGISQIISTLNAITAYNLVTPLPFVLTQRQRSLAKSVGKRDTIFVAVLRPYFASDAINQGIGPMTALRKSLKYVIGARTTGMPHINVLRLHTALIKKPKDRAYVLYATG